MTQRRTFGYFMLAGWLALPACGGDDDDSKDRSGKGGHDDADEGDAEGNGGRDQSNSCGLQNCETGQHCYNMVCLDGCLSDNNCGSNQTCQDIDTDSHVGTCRTKPTTTNKDCTSFCAKAQACFLEGNDINPGNCMQACTAASKACVSCVNDSNCGQGCDDACGSSFGG
jgi:hypothetical protein